jgi:hypothetical protein
MKYGILKRETWKQLTLHLSWQIAWQLSSSFDLRPSTFVLRSSSPPNQTHMLRQCWKSIWSSSSGHILLTIWRFHSGKFEELQGASFLKGYFSLYRIVSDVIKWKNKEIKELTLSRVINTGVHKITLLHIITRPPKFLTLSRRANILFACKQNRKTKTYKLFKDDEQIE